jgi:hypothetical protein
MLNIQYSENLSNVYKSKNGVFFTTNNEIINNIINIVDVAEVNNKVILEPSCGNGMLILELMKKIHNYHNSQLVMDNFLKHNLIFNDIDLDILNECIYNIKELYCKMYNQQIDYTLNGFNVDFTKKKDLMSSSEIYQYLSKIDYVIGNPPYITLYGRRDKKKTEAERDYFLSTYNQFPKKLQNGKINYVMLFIEHSLDFLKPNGQLSFIIDAAFNETAYKYTREYLLNNYNIDEIIHNISEFDNVASGQIILKISNTKNNDKTKITDYKTKNEYYKNSLDWKNEETEHKFNFQKECNLTNQIISKITNKTSTIQSIYLNKSIRTCSMLLNMEDKFVSKISAGYQLNQNEYLYYVGSKSLKDKFYKMKTDKILKYDKQLQDEINNTLKIQLEKEGIKNKKRIGMGDELVFKNPKVFIRQSCKNIVASFDDNLSTSNNSLYVFSFRDNSEQSMKELMFICGYLNSSISTFIAQKTAIVRHFVGKQPQIKISDLIKLPIITDIRVKDQISNITESIYNNSITIDNGIELINKTLNEHFELNKNEIEFIENQISSF